MSHQGIDENGNLFRQTIDAATGLVTEQTQHYAGRQQYFEPKDVSLNGYIDAGDAQLIRDYLNQNPPPPSGPRAFDGPVYDVNNDGYISPIDVLRIENFLYFNPDPGWRYVPRAMGARRPPVFVGPGRPPLTGHWQCRRGDRLAPTDGRRDLSRTAGGVVSAQICAHRNTEVVVKGEIGKPVVLITVFLAMAQVGLAQRTGERIEMDVNHLDRITRANARVAAKKTSVDSDPAKPIFHIMPAAGSAGDPNGVIYAKGKYHVFFQHAPEFEWGKPAEEWEEGQPGYSNTGWGHASSEDLVHWEHEPIR